MGKPAPEFYSSQLSRFCAEELEGDFHFLDGDEVIYRHSALPIVYARETGILRVIECKRPGEDVRRSQRETLPLLAAGIESLIENSLLDSRSGVFILEGEYPWADGAQVSRIMPHSKPGVDWSSVGASVTSTYTLSNAQLRLFIRCRPVLEAKAA